MPLTADQAKIAYSEMVQSSDPAFDRFVPGLTIVIDREVSDWYSTLEIRQDDGALVAKPALAELEAVYTAWESEQNAEAVNENDLLTRLQNSGLLDKTTTQIYTQLQNQIDSWQTLADAKSGLRTMIPLIAAATLLLYQDRDG